MWATMLIDTGGWFTRICIWRVVVAACFLSCALPADSRERPNPNRNQIACPLDAPEDYAVLPDPPGADDEDDEDEDEDEDESESSAGPGIRVGPNQCIFPNLEVTAGNQSAWLGGAIGKGLGPMANAPFVGQLNTTIGLTHVDNSWAGGLVTVISYAGSSDFSLSQASVHSKYFGFGLMSSRFDAWSGDEFSFRAIAPSQSPYIMSIVPWRSDNSIFVISAEDPVFRRVTVSGYGPSRMPDAIVRWVGRLQNFDLTLSGATHETVLTSGGSLRGWAGLASLRWNLPKLGDGSYVLAQVSVANKALGFLGINTSTNTYAFTLPTALNATTAEAGRGVAGALVGFWQRTDEWAYAAYLTGTKLSLPGVFGGNILSWRTALNSTWTPFEGLSIGVEGAFARVQSNVPFVPSGNAKTILITMTRTAF